MKEESKESVDFDIRDRDLQNHLKMGIYNEVAKKISEKCDEMFDNEKFFRSEISRYFPFHTIYKEISRFPKRIAYTSKWIKILQIEEIESQK